jgi:hypothetical protein
MAYTDIDKSDDYFNTVLYTGTGATQSITGVGFQPDFTWIKRRSTLQDHNLYDAIRGATKALESNSTSVEQTKANDLTAFASDGFTLGSGIKTNANGETHASWNWLADNTSGSSNTDGSITSTVSANTTAGFSIVSYTGNGSDNATIGHGLGVKPDCLIVKNRDDGADGWGYWNKGMGAETQQMALNMTNAVFTDDVFKSSSSITVTLGIDTWSNVNTEKYIMYAFAEKKGYSKFGSYTGNGSTNGTFVYTGFKPAWIMVKRTDSTNDWMMFDNKRDTFNTAQKYLRANLSNAEAGTTDYVDFLSNGVKFRRNGNDVNGSGASYIYMAFAENPFVTSTGIPACAR